MKQETKSAIKLINALNRTEIVDSVNQSDLENFERQRTNLDAIYLVEKLSVEEIAKIERTRDKLWSLKETRNSISNAIEETKKAMEEGVVNTPEADKDSIANIYGEELGHLEYELGTIDEEIRTEEAKKLYRRVIVTWDDATEEEIKTLNKYERLDIDKLEYID